MIKSLGDKWNRFWFEPSTADNLGLARILVFGSMAIFYFSTPYLFPAWGWHQTFNEWGGVDSAFWQPIWLFRVLHLPQLSTQALSVMDAIWKLSLICAAIGFFTRSSAAVAGILSIYLFGLPNNFGKTHHLEVMLLWAFLIFAIGRSGDAWSVDKLIRTARAGLGAAIPPKRRSGEYTWPIRLIWVVMAMIYFEAGVSKLRHSGIGWVTSDAMAFFLRRAQYHITDAEPLSNWGLWIANHGWSSHLLAFMGISLELSYPLALFSKRLRWIIMPSGMLMQTGIAVLMGPNFYQMIICQLLWLPLDKIVYGFLGLFAGKKTYAVIFDGSCGLCKQTIGVVRSLDLLGKVEYLDAVNRWPEIQRRYPNLDRGHCLEDMHAVDSHGKISVGFYAYRGLAWVLPLGWPIVPLLYIPGVPWIGSRVYRMVAEHRLSGACALPTAVAPASPVASEATMKS
jgi:predicted DCC family thiol-disulfide oxidoreductase YuxK